ncbi:MAG: ABC transporter substrate-binding protein [Deltaproteobacteria bacterium]|nr:ABC transporter substrate-binding protein [Deltaproteobacteria bacterium]
MSKKTAKRVASRSLQLTRRSLLKGLGGLVATGAASSLVGTGRAWSASKEISIGTFGPSHCSIPMVSAKLRGFFKNEKVNITLVNYPEMPLIAKDLIGGKLDFGQLIVPLAFAIHAGTSPLSKERVPLVIPQIAGTNGAALMVGSKSAIKNPADFKGRIISNHSKLSVHFLLNMMFLERHGLSFEKDVTFKVVELDHAIDALKSGEVDSFVMPEPKDAAIELAGVGTPLMLSKYLWPNHPCCALVARRDSFERDRELSTALVRMTTKAGLLANEPSSRESTIDLLRTSSDYRYDKVPKPVLMKALVPGRSDFYPFPFQSTARAIIDIMKRYQLLPAGIDSKAFAREVFLSELSRTLIRELGSRPPESDFREEKVVGQVMTFAD